MASVTQHMDVDNNLQDAAEELTNTAAELEEVLENSTDNISDGAELQGDAADSESEAGDTTMNRLYRCGVCGVTSADITELKVHMVETHVNNTNNNDDAEEVSEEEEQPVEDDGDIFGERTNFQMASQFEHGSHEIGVESVPQTQPPIVNENYLDVDLNFKVKMPNYEMPMFPKHIKPALFFACAYCDYQHQSTKQVSIHIFENHPKKLEYKLRARRMEADSQNSQDVAVINNSAYLTKGTVKKYKTLLFQSEQKSSRKTDKADRPFSCALCNMKCDKELILDIHKRCHVEGSKKLCCCFCSKEAPPSKSWYGLFIHMVNKHPEEVPAPMSCNVCKKGFVKEFDLQKHMACHSMDRPFVCDLCGYTFKYKKNLQDHGVLKHKLGTEEERMALIRRMRKRPKPELDPTLPWMQCEVCSYKTKVKSKYNIHAKIHTGVKDIKCGYCDYRTGDRSSLRRHEWRHREHKPFSCKFCDFSCIQRPQIIAHYKNKHSLQPSDASKIVQHINGSRQYYESDEVDLEITEEDTVVITHNPHEDGNAITIQHVTGDNPVDISLLTEAAEGLLAASQIELHST